MTSYDLSVIPHEIFNNENMKVITMVQRKGGGLLLPDLILNSDIETFQIHKSTLLLMQLNTFIIKWKIIKNIT